MSDQRVSEFLSGIASTLDGEDFRRMIDVVVMVGEVEAAGDFYEKVKNAPDSFAALGDHIDWLQDSALNLANSKV